MATPAKPVDPLAFEPVMLALSKARAMACVLDLIDDDEVIHRLLPMELQIGDRLTDETGEWEVISRPYASAGGKIASAHVRQVGKPEVTDLRSWSAHERIEVKRT